jgi:hypothetical protein
MTTKYTYHTSQKIGIYCKQQICQKNKSKLEIIISHFVYCKNDDILPKKVLADTLLTPGDDLGCCCSSFSSVLENETIAHFKV